MNKILQEKKLPGILGGMLEGGVITAQQEDTRAVDIARGEVSIALRTTGDEGHTENHSQTGEVVKEKTLNYSELRQFFEENIISMPKDAMAACKEKIMELRGGSSKIADQKEYGAMATELPQNPLDMYLALTEASLRQLPAFGQDFSIDSKNLYYKGDLKVLKIAIQSGFVDNIVVSCFPSDIEEESMDMRETDWLLQQLIDAKILDGIQEKEEYGGYQPVRSMKGYNNEKMSDVVNQKMSRIQFICSFKGSSYGIIPEVSNASIIKKIETLGGRYPDFPTLLRHLAAYRSDVTFITEGEKVTHEAETRNIMGRQLLLVDKVLPRKRNNLPPTAPFVV